VNCQLTYKSPVSSGTVKFEFPGQCQFSRNSLGEIRVVQTGQTKTLLIESSKKVSPSVGLQTRDCDTFIRGVTVSENDVSLSAQTQKVAQCLPAVWDEKIFHVFAANKLPVSKLTDNPSQR